MKKNVFSLLLSICLVAALLASTSASATGALPAVAQDEVNSLSLRVNELAARVESTSPTGTADEQRRLYLTLDKEIDILESEIDLLEDRYELDYLTGVLPLDEYRSLERELDRLEDRLDRAEDYLERAFRAVR